MDVLLRYDRAITLWLGRRLRRAQGEVSYNLHKLLFWSAFAVHVVIWIVLCLLEQQPEWILPLFGLVAGTASFYVVDDEVIARLDEGLGLTHFGHDERWVLLRVGYVAMAVFVLAPTILTGEFGLLVKLLFLAELALFVLLEYLLTFRFFDEVELQALAKQQMDELRTAVKTIFDPAPAEAGAPNEPEPDPQPPLE